MTERGSKGEREGRREGAHSHTHTVEPLYSVHNNKCIMNLSYIPMSADGWMKW